MRPHMYIIDVVSVNTLYATLFVCVNWYHELAMFDVQIKPYNSKSLKLTT